MGAALVFIFRSSIVMLAMYLVYKTMLSGEKQHGYNRGILIAIYVLSPLVVWLTTIVLSFGGDGVVVVGQLTDSEMLELLMANVVSRPVAASMAPKWTMIALWAWLAGIATVVCATVLSWLRVRWIIKHCVVEHRPGYTLALSPDETIAPFSMRRTVVMSRRDYDEAGEMILVHELRHIACRHWIDIVVARVVAAVAWFNPVSWLIGEELRMVHEYQADAAVLRSGADARSYQMLLIKKAAGRSFPAIANSLNHSNLKKRITMMLKSKSAKGRRWRSLAMVPTVVAVLALTNLPDVASALAVMNNASLSGSKGTQKSADREIKRVPIDSIRNLSPGTVERMEIVKGESFTKNPRVLQSNHDQPVVEAPIEMSTHDNSYVFHGTPVVFIDGKKASHDEMSKLASSRIKSIKVDKADESHPNGVIYVELNKEAEKDAETALAHFKGGEPAMYAWIATHIKMPKVKDAPKNARVLVRFIVDETGKVGEVEILRGSIDEYNAEALRVVSELPDFIPATENGNPIATSYVVPISFKLQ